MERKYYYLNPGYIFYSDERYLVETVLGSCISVCLWDEKRLTGGINHFIFPGNGEKENSSKYGTNATQHLIKMVLESGSRIENIQAYIIGGANNRLMDLDIGGRNKKNAEEILGKYGIKIRGKWTGGYCGRKISFDTYTGEVEIFLLKESGG